MARPIFDRRRRTLIAAALGAAVHPLWAGTLVPTPRQSAGPFYPTTLPIDDDADLTRVKGHDGVARGRHAELSGRVLDTSARPLAGARVEIWQCDANGRYHHPGDRRSVAIDPGFQGHGHTITDGDGGYRFRTIRPVHYPGRTPHIHAAVFLPGERPYVTQIYVKGEPRNEQDFLFGSIPSEQRELVLVDFRDAGGGAVLDARFNLVVGATPREQA